MVEYNFAYNLYTIKTSIRLYNLSCCCCSSRIVADDYYDGDVGVAVAMVVTYFYGFIFL